ncbi:MAG TPA: HEAT repeat domain-containing protein [Planctomycetota bacterium]|nr:HEAT repeat domain-containing protein [Planctomycetota bacterium]HRR79813.1 HEAT repeat domain-containing protein [Planctomycetota bacterium]HRT96134.1 HEAT repeat domain-containing protein [Planctomycetota bacterium]
MGKCSREELARQVESLVDGLDLTSAASDGAAEAASGIAALGADAVACLVHSALRRDAARRDRVAAILGSFAGEAARWARDALAAALNSPVLNPTERMWLSAVCRGMEEACSGRPRPGTPLPGDLLDDEGELILWRDEFACLLPEEQEAVLAPLLQDGNPALLRLLEAVTSLQVPQVDAAVAAGLARFATPAALPLLRELLRRPDPAVRAHARATLGALERQGVDVRGVFVAEPTPTEPVLAALVGPPWSDGRLMVLVARHQAPASLRFAAVIVDPVELGIVTTWGQTGMSAADFRRLLADYTQKMGQSFAQVDVNVAQALVAAAEEYAVRRGHTLSPDYLVWRRCIGRPSRPVPLPIVFGPKCSECDAALGSGDMRRGAIIAGRVALCARCAAQPRLCAVCQRLLSRGQEGVRAREGPEPGKMEFLCRHCARGR